jgi:hypothetical protein
MRKMSLRSTKTTEFQDSESKAGLTLWKRSKTIELSEERVKLEKQRSLGVMICSEDDKDEDASEAGNTGGQKPNLRGKSFARSSADLAEHFSLSQKAIRMIVGSKQFGVACLMAIIGNAAWIGAQTEATVKHRISCTLSANGGHVCEEEKFLEFKIGAYFFTGFFTIEILLRSLDYGANPQLAWTRGRLWFFFFGPDWNWNSGIGVACSPLEVPQVRSYSASCARQLPSFWLCTAAAAH